MISSSTIINQSIQPDGRSYVIEQHKTDDGRKILLEYLADADLDIQTRMEERVFELEEELIKEEEERITAEKLLFVLNKHSAYINSLSITDAKQVFDLATDEEALLLKDNLK